MKSIAAYFAASVLVLTAVPLAARAQVTGSVSVDGAVSGALGGLGIGANANANVDVESDSRRQDGTRHRSVQQRTAVDADGDVEVRRTHLSTRAKARASTMIESENGR